MNGDSTEVVRVDAPPVLRTARLVCERFTMEHVDELAVIDRDETVQRWLFGKTYTREETEARARRRVAYWDEHGAGDYIVRTPDGQFIGFAGFFPSARPGAIAIGYALRPECWGSGYGSELAAVLTSTAKALGVPEIVATVRATNAASRRILEKSGFVVMGPADADDPETLVYRYAGSAGTESQP
ncbi:MAG: GNAT family N-acetyltransferase [Candidatus Eremiobacteraeota bacterium]|nr:GNAT family N-acetyltransferase [Candidatus Eremiobacteraeota bacterium]